MDMGTLINTYSEQSVQGVCLTCIINAWSSIGLLMKRERVGGSVR